MGWDGTEQDLRIISYSKKYQLDPSDVETLT